MPLLYIAGLVISVLLIAVLLPYLRGSTKKTLPQQLKLRFGKNTNYMQQIIIQNFRSAKHRFEATNKAGLYYCNVCSKLLGGLCSGQNLECKVCGILLHSLCKYKTKPDCKHICQIDMQAKSTHQWVPGNLPMNSVCVYCELICTSYYRLEGSSCLYCQKVVHDECRDKINPICSHGVLEKQIISPVEILYLSDATRQQRTQVESSNLSSSEGEEIPIYVKSQKQILGVQELSLKFVIQEKKTPIIVLINRNSGGQSGQAFLNSFYRYLNPIQVISIIDDGMERLKCFNQLREVKVLVAGGDGTVGSCINYMRQEKFSNNQAPIAILPLGTGNDLSRALGWVKHFNKSQGGAFDNIDAHDILQQVASINNQVLLDRWKVQLRFPQTKPRSRLSRLFQRDEQQEFVMLNYFGIGLDARFCLGFHNLRQKNPNLFKSRIGNKFIYGQMGLNDFITGKKLGLGKMITLMCDGVLVDVPEKVENLVVLNINSWAGGVSGLWSVDQDNFKPQRCSDGLLEIIGITSILHLGRIQVGIDKPIMIAQGRDIQIIINHSTSQAIQVDGEPLAINTPSHRQSKDLIPQQQVQMLSKVETTLVNWEHKLLTTMKQAQDKNLVTQEGKDYILEMMLS